MTVCLVKIYTLTYPGQTVLSESEGLHLLYNSKNSCSHYLLTYLYSSIVSFSNSQWKYAGLQVCVFALYSVISLDFLFSSLIFFLAVANLMFNLPT